MVQTMSVEEMKSNIGMELGTSDWLLIDQDRINKFADCTEDHQWIHVDEKMAAQGPFGTTIAHGFLSLSLISYLSAENMILPEGVTMAINYGLNKVRFINPVKVNKKVRDKTVLSGVEEKPGNRVLVTITHTIEIEGEEKPACIAESLAMFFVQ